jgi:uncharacterized phage protein gp47/JayE
MKIKNNAGETVEFEISKLENSLRSGADEQSVKKFWKRFCQIVSKASQPANCTEWLLRN